MKQLKTIEEMEEAKNNLIEELEDWKDRTAWKEGKTKLALIIRLIEGTRADDPDLKEALEDETAYYLINLLLDCYDSTDFIAQLEYQDFDPFRDYRYSEREYKEDHTAEEWEEITGDCLTCSDICAVVSW